MSAGSDTARFESAVAAIDAANADDPETLLVRGAVRSKEQAHAELVTEWVRRLRPGASEALLLAARAHHVRRWEIPRASHPAGRAGYHRWRRALQEHHARIAREIVLGSGYDDATAERVADILRKRGLGSDDEVQTFEDALCLTFLETQLAGFAAEHDAARARDVLAKTLRKMSPAARDAAAALPLPDDGIRRILADALASGAE